MRDLSLMVNLPLILIAAMRKDASSRFARRPRRANRKSAYYRLTPSPTRPPAAGGAEIPRPMTVIPAQAGIS